MRKVFGDTVDYSRIRIRASLGGADFAGAALIPRTTKTATKRKKRKIIFSPSWMRRIHRDQIVGLQHGIAALDLPHGGVLAHEIMHIRQEDRLGPEEMVRRVDAEEASLDDPYDYEPFMDRPFPEWPLEAQGVAAGAYYLAQVDPWFAKRSVWLDPIFQKVKAGIW